jgi:hypothetical protein
LTRYIGVGRETTIHSRASAQIQKAIPIVINAASSKEQALILIELANSDVLPKPLPLTLAWYRFSKAYRGHQIARNRDAEKERLLAKLSKALKDMK